MSTSTITEGLAQVAQAIAKAEQAVGADPSASPVTAAVVQELARKSAKAVAAADRDAVIELEQAGDSAKAAAEADTGLSDATRQAILDGHLAICVLKANVVGR